MAENMLVMDTRLITMNNLILCCCNWCDCKDECEYYEETVQPVIKAATTVYENDIFGEALKYALSKFVCEYFEDRI